jgi:hypothetical protein
MEPEIAGGGAMKTLILVLFIALSLRPASALAQDTTQIYRMPVVELKQMVLDMSELIRLRQLDSLNWNEINALKADNLDYRRQLVSLKEIAGVKDKQIKVLEDSKPGILNYVLWGGAGAAVGLVVGYAVGHAAGN